MKLKELLETDLKDLKMNPIDLRFLLEDIGIEFKFHDPSNNITTFGDYDESPISGGYTKGFHTAGHYSSLQDSKKEDFYVSYELDEPDKIRYYPNQYKLELYIHTKYVDDTDTTDGGAIDGLIDAYYKDHTHHNVISLIMDLRKYYPIDLNLSGAVKSMNESIKSFKRFTTK